MEHGTREGPEQINKINGRMKKKNNEHEFLMFFAASTFQAPGKFTDTHYDMVDYQKLKAFFKAE